MSAPPPVTVPAPMPPMLQEAGEITAVAAEEPIVANEVIVATAFGDGELTWTENAESGLTQIIDGTHASYSLIKSGVGIEGSKAFHLVHAAPDTQSFELDVDIDVLADTKLFFMSKLQRAADTQFAQIRISKNGGGWKSVYSQSGTGTSGEGGFILRTLDLGSSFNGDQVRIRFDYNHAGSYNPGTSTSHGWLIDNIQVGAEYQKTEWTIGNPTPTEVLYLEYINRARADAIVEANRLDNLTDSNVVGAYNYFGIETPDIVDQFAYYVSNGCMGLNAQPLAFQRQLMEIAKKHSQDMFSNQFQGHDSSLSPPAPFQPGDTFAQRLSRVGYSGAAGENVYAHSKSVEYGHAGFNVDWGNLNGSGSCSSAAFNNQGMQNPAGHRKTIHASSYNEIGVGVINDASGSVGPQIVTQDFGGSSATYICGVVYEDSDGNGMYSAASDSNHEGAGGVRVDVVGSGYYAISRASGAYAIPVSGDGTYQVTFSGGGIGTFNTQVVVGGGLNVKLDHLLENNEAASRYHTWAAGYDLVGGPDDDDDKDGVSNVIESVIAGMSPTVADSHLLPRFVKQPGGDWILCLNRQAEANDVIVTVKLSSDLVNWQPAGTMPNTTLVTNTASELTIRASSSHRTLYARYYVTLAP